jgi:hypothetical protein
VAEVDEQHEDSATQHIDEIDHVDDETVAAFFFRLDVLLVATYCRQFVPKSAGPACDLLYAEIVRGTVLLGGVDGVVDFDRSVQDGMSGHLGDIFGGLLALGTRVAVLVFAHG